MFSKEWLMKNKLVAISRKVAKEDIKNTAKALYEGGIRSLEITFDQSNPNCIEETVRSIEIVREVMGERMMIGAGTVLNVEQAIAAAKAGASFVLSPDTNVKVIDKVKDLGLISVPGAMTPSEIMVAWNHGADIVKLFPAGILTLAYYKAIKGPISHVPLMAVGGVGLENMKSFLDAGFCSCGIGSNIVRNDLIASKRFNDLTNLAKEYLSQIEEKTE